MAWRLAKCIERLRDEVNAAHLGRPKQTDGTKGDARHEAQGSASDHNAWLNNTVRAWDITTWNFTDALAEKLRAMGAAGDPRLVGGGMVIHKGRIASDNGGWAWRKYTGSDPHTSHIHLSVSRNAAGYDSTAPWGVVAPVPQQEDDMFSDTDRAKLDEAFNKIANIEGNCGAGGHFQGVFTSWDSIILGLDDGNVDVEQLASALAGRLGDDVAKALGERLANG